MEICKGMNQWETPIFAFWKWERYRGGQFRTESEFSEEKTFHFRISGWNLFSRNFTL